MLTVGVWIQFAILAAVIAIMSWMVKRPSKVAPALLMVILVVDLLSALPYDIKPDGIEYYAISAKETQPSVHALAIAARSSRRRDARSPSAGRRSMKCCRPRSRACGAFRLPAATARC